MRPKLEDRLVQVQLDLRLEGVYDDLAVGPPLLVRRPVAVRQQLVALDAAPPLVVADDDELPRQVAVAEPELVLGEEPARVVGGVELAEVCAWERRRDRDAGDVGLDERLPQKVTGGVDM